MNFDELSKILHDEAGINVCPICGTPFDKRYKQQKTCGAADCRRAHKNQYLRERRERLLEEDREAYNEKRAEAERKYRYKKKAKEAAERDMEKVKAYWERRKTSEDRVTGEDYGKRQMEKTLAMIPKIDVNIDGKERKNNDDVHGKDNAERGGGDSKGQ